MALAPLNLFTPAGLRLHADGTIDVEIPPRMGGDQDGWVVASFHVESDKDVHGDCWEIHPSGQEVVSVLSGRARVVLRPEDDGEEQAVTLDAGTAFVVPRNRWHRLEIDGPTDLQSITPRHGSRLEARV